MDHSPPGSSVRGILQARILEWVPISFFRDLPDPGIEPESPALLADSLLSEPSGKLLDGVLFYNFLEVYTLCWASQVAQW